MRIIAGSLRGRTLKSTQTSMLRPTTDRVRESMFNILASRMDMEDARVLDLFAGTGALGIEALSRGAGRCEFVENDRRAAAVIVENVEALGVKDRAHVHVRDVLKFIAGAAGPYDLVLADPPYAASIFERLPRELFERGLVAAGGLVLIEHAGTTRIVPPAGTHALVERSFGDSAITLLAHAGERGLAPGEIEPAS